ncbi:MAG: vanadium-dependent haloperoxidase [Euryarchaeota archaeon]|nr:vanadium-dependent haloperoxidase [Euryarchaeota archaeon]
MSVQWDATMTKKRQYDGEKNRDSTTAGAETSSTNGGYSRRRVLGGLGVASALSLVGAGGLATANGADEQGSSQNDRLERAYEIRRTIADRLRETSVPNHETNGDEQRYENRIATFTKGLPHDDLGEVDPDAYDELLDALETGDGEDFEAVTVGDEREFIEPQAAFGFTVAGYDPHTIETEAPPRFDSAEAAAELAEIYWMALVRDVPFQEYEDNELIRAAAHDLTEFSDFAGPMVDGEVTPQTVFRNVAPGVTTGPYVSQFLLKRVPEGALFKDQRIRTAQPDVDYITDYDDWLATIRGETIGPEEGEVEDDELFDPEPRYIRSGRDLTAYVQRDVMFGAYVNAVLIIIGDNVDGIVANPEEIYDEASPYGEYETQAEFVNFGRPGVLDLVAGVTQPAHSAAWFQKWLVHRSLRPEQFGGRVHNHLRDDVDVTYPINDELFESPVLERIYDEYGSHLVPQAFPEGGPTHPAYPSGHGAVAGACTTVLKAVFDEDYEIEEPVQATADGLNLEPCPVDEPLTIGGELNKLASNANAGRVFGGVHYRGNTFDGIGLGEQVAIGYLRDIKLRYNEYPDEFDEWTFTNVMGEEVTI